MFNHNFRKDPLKNDSQKDPISGAVAAALGAGIVTTFAVGQGQHPMIALSITALSAAAALLLDRVLQRS